MNITATQALNKLLKMDNINTIIDVGSGQGLHAKIFRDNGKQVITNSLEPNADLVGDFLKLDIQDKFDCVWAAHVLEHQPNPNIFLQKCFNVLEDDGVLAVTVPPLKHNIVGGHVSLWNAGILIYQCIMAGFDCKNAMVKKYGYNISLIVRKKSFEMPILKMDNGDIEMLKNFFPMPVEQGFFGNFDEVNWK